MKNIIEIAKKIDICSDDIFCYGNYIAKIDKEIKNETNGKLILVTSINPTPEGEGKTTLSIGLNDSLNKIGKKTIAVLREPSLGPVFGVKGGAIGAGNAKLFPEQDINLHFTGDFHAITSANNLICAIVDNHIYQGNELGIDRVTFKRCIDINDRSLRDKFVITPASEIMAIVCLSKSIEDLKRRISNIIVGYKKDNTEVYVKDLECTNAVLNLLKYAIKPNLVQTNYENPVIVHGGPFANIAHGCNSIIATNLALSISDYVVTEAGFGSDMGAIKFFDIKCREANIYPEVVIINTTVKALKYHGKGLLHEGILNLKYHIENMQKFNSNVLVAINKFESDTEEELNFIIEYCKKLNVDATICTMYIDGENGCIDLANKIINLNENTINKTIYELSDSIFLKIEKMCKLFGCNNIKYSDEIYDKLKEIDRKKINYKICISKTPSSITDNSKILGYPTDFEMTITDVEIKNGAELIVLYMGKVITLPGLGKNSKYLYM